MYVLNYVYVYIYIYIHTRILCVYVYVLFGAEDVLVASGAHARIGHVLKEVM